MRGLLLERTTSIPHSPLCAETWQLCQGDLQAEGPDELERPQLASAICESESPVIRVGLVIRPTRYRDALTYFKGRAIRILDIGCGDNSPSLAKRWFPRCTYHAADIQDYNLTEEDKRSIDAFYKVTTDYNGYDAIKDADYDFVIASHVIEHTDDPLRLTKIAASKVKPGGMIWLSFPSFKSLSLPPGIGVTNHFCDDPTHIRVVDVVGVCNELLRSNIRILKAGRSRDPVRELIGLALLPLNWMRMAIQGGVGRGLWYVMGFEDRIVGVKR
jgi:SAM-dependent methyltransferase